MSPHSGSPGLLDADLPGLQDLRTALTLSSPVLLRRPGELAAQLCGRLDTRSSSAAWTVTTIARATERTSLLPVTSTLHGPDSQLVSVLTGLSLRPMRQGFTWDGRAVFGTNDDTTLRLWDLRTGTELAVLAGHSAPPHAAVISDDLAVSAARDGRVLAWNLRNGTIADVLAERIEPAIRVERLGSLGYRNTTITVVFESGDVLAWRHDGDSTITSIDPPDRLLPKGFWDGTTTATGRFTIDSTGDTWAREKDNIAWGTVEITDTDREVTHRHIGHFDRGAPTVGISPDGAFAWGSSRSAGTIVWRLSLHKPAYAVAMFREGTDGIWFTPEGDADAMSITRHGAALKVWSLEKASNRRGTPVGSDIGHLSRIGHSRRVTDIAIADGARLAVSLAQHESERLWAWDLDGADPPRSLWEDYAEATAVTLTPDGRTAVLGMDGGWVRFQPLTGNSWETGPVPPIEQGAVAREIWEPTTDIVVTDDGQACATIAYDDTKYWSAAGTNRNGSPLDDARTRGELDQLLDAAQSISPPFAVDVEGSTITVSRHRASASFTADAPIATWSATEDRLVIGDSAGVVHVLSVELPEQAEPVPDAPEAPTDAIIQVTVDRTTGDVVTGGAEGTVVVWTGWPLEPVRVLAPHNAGIAVLAADGGVIASADAGGLVVVTDGERRLSRRLTELPTAIAVTGAGRVAVIGDSSGTVRIWDLDDDSVRLAEGYHEGSVNSVAVSDDGRFVYTGGEDGRVRRLEVATGKSLSQKLRDTAIAAVARLDDGSILFITDQGAIWHYSDPGVKAEKLVTGWTGLMSLATVPGGARVVVRQDERSRLWHYPSTVAAYVESAWHLAYPGHERLIVVEPGARRPVLVDYP